MKIRTDFVTNSSSSSYICAFGQIDNKEKAMKFLTGRDLGSSSVMTGAEVLETLFGRWGNRIGADWAGVYIDLDKKKIDEKAEYLVWQSWGGAGDDDYAFMCDYGNGDWGSPDYGVTLCDFAPHEQSIYSGVTEENGFAEIQSGYGAGRNG